MRTSLAPIVNRKLRLESLEPRYMLAGDVLDFASMLPEAHLHLTQEIMGHLQEQAELHGVNPTHLLGVSAIQHPLDTNGDGFVTPLDALLVIRELNDRSVARSGAEGMPDSPRPNDVNRDGIVTPLDALRVIKGLNEGRYAQGHWWDSGELNEVVVGALEQVQNILADQGLEHAADEVTRISDLILEHTRAVRQEVTSHLDDRGYEIHSEGLLGFLSDVENQVQNHLGFVHDQIRRHLEYTDGGFYDAVVPNGELSRAEVDQLLDQILQDRQPGYGPRDDGTVAWHVDFVRDLIDQHQGLVHEGRDIDEIHELIDSHVDYVVELLQVHGVNASDTQVGEVLSHVHHIVDWVDGLADGEHPGEPLGLPYVPASVQHHLDSVWDHVGYVRDLVNLHHGQTDSHDDWRTLVASHIGFVGELLELHGLLNDGIFDGFSHGTNRR